MITPVDNARGSPSPCFKAPIQLPKNSVDRRHRMIAMSEFENPYEGKQPRKADQLRSRIARLTHANEDRVSRVEGDAREERQRISFIKRRQRLAVHLAKKTRFGDITEFELITDRNSRNDFTVGELEEFLISKLDMNCPQCHYLLRGLRHVGSCPECGARYATGGFDWEVLRDILSVELALPPPAIDRSTGVLHRLRELCVEPDPNQSSPSD